MPRLTPHRHRALVRLLPALCLALSARQPAQAQAPLVAVRPTGPHLTVKVIKAFAAAAPAKKLSKADYPDAGKFTPVQIVTALCGRASPDYLKLLEERTGLTDQALAAPAGSMAYSLEFPNCATVNTYSEPLRYVAKSGDTFNTIRKAFTGVEGSYETTAHFFDVPMSRVVNHALKPGDIVKVPYSTAATLLPQDQADALIADINQGAGGGAVKFVSTSNAHRGHIVTFTGGLGVPETPPECGTAPAQPFVAADLVAAWKHSLERGVTLHQRTSQPADVMVADNGFFGAKVLQTGGFAFRTPQFDARYFNNSRFPGNIGPLFGEPPDQVYPINFQNRNPAGTGRLTPNGPLSGHGTHVTGLVLGGAQFSEADREAIFGESPAAWLQITEFNVGDGSDDLLPNAAAELSAKLGILDGTQIVNLSLSFDRDAAILHNFDFMTPTSTAATAGRHLFVVAAGNDKRQPVANYYPAALGGLDQSATVVTVAAITPGGALTQFTNIGGAVDVAAPGCNLSSWTDDSGPPVLLSGTSQAAPIVTFEAALIRSLTGRDPWALKARIVASGDLLNPTERDKVSSHLKVNLPKALYVFEDYVAWDAGPGVGMKAVLGRVLKVGGVVCSQDGLALDADRLIAYKSDGSSAFGYYYAADGKRLSACPVGGPGADDEVVVKPLFDVAPNYPEHAATEPALRLKASQVRDIVKRAVDGGDALPPPT